MKYASALLKKRIVSLMRERITNIISGELGSFMIFVTLMILIDWHNPSLPQRGVSRQLFSVEYYIWHCANNRLSSAKMASSRLNYYCYQNILIEIHFYDKMIYKKFSNLTLI